MKISFVCILMSIIPFTCLIRLKTSQILCSQDPYNDCLQYFTGETQIFYSKPRILFYDAMQRTKIYSKESQHIPCPS